MKLRKQCVLVVPENRILVDEKGRAYQGDCKLMKRTFRERGIRKIKLRDV